MQDHAHLPPSYEPLVIGKEDDWAPEPVPKKAKKRKIPVPAGI
jgi:hypothetical protein